MHHVVAISGSPAGRAVTVHGKHFQIGGQQVVTAVGFLPGTFEKELGVEALAHQAALHVGKSGNYSIDFVGRDQFLKRFQCQVTRHSSKISG